MTLSDSVFQTVNKQLAVAYKITNKAINAKDIDHLIFIILNDTYHVIKYDRSILLSKILNDVQVVGVSGQATFNSDTELLTKIKELVKQLKDPEKSRVLEKSDFTDGSELWDYLQAQKATTVFWSSFKLKDGTQIGLWMEKWEDSNAPQEFNQNAQIMTEFLQPGFLGAWERISKSYSWQKVRAQFSLRRAGLLSAAIFVLFFVIPINLRIVVPCEVVAKDPSVIAAPLNGIIEKILVQPGQFVQKDEALYHYDSRIPEQEYKVSLKEVDIIQSELNRAFASGLRDPKQIYQLATLNVQLKKSQLNVDFTKRQLDLLIGKAPLAGVAIVDNPDDWRGKPVKIGERIMELSDPGKTKVKLWISEKDHINFILEEPIKVFLNPTPEKSLKAKLKFIGKEVKIDEHQLPSFIGEADWLEESDAIKLGLKGSAILYGKKVSLFYYLFRKPILSLRTFFGV